MNRIFHREKRSAESPVRIRNRPADHADERGYSKLFASISAKPLT